jgi:hypothetical protein
MARQLKLEVNEGVVTLTVGENKLSRTYQDANTAAQNYSMFEQEIKKQLTLLM